MSQKMTVIKSNSKKQSLGRSELKVNVHGNLEGKTLQAPLNDKAEYKNVDSSSVRVPVPSDGSVPTWRCKNGAILPMVWVQDEDMYKPRMKKGPAKGKKYSARKGRAAKVADLVVKPNLVQEQAEKMEIAPTVMTPTEAAWAKLTKFQQEMKTEEEAEPKFEQIPKEGVDFLSLVQSLKMKNSGKISDDLEFAIVKNTIVFRQAAAQN